jgi:Biotin carboxylase, N-terminal domain
MVVALVIVPLNRLSVLSRPILSVHFILSVVVMFIMYCFSKLFDKILIANRGEIACRIIKTVKKLGAANAQIEHKSNGLFDCSVDGKCFTVQSINDGFSVALLYSQIPYSMSKYSR